MYEACIVCDDKIDNNPTEQFSYQGYDLKIPYFIHNAFDLINNPFTKIFSIKINILCQECRDYLKVVFIKFLGNFLTKHK